ncbi:MAG: hypothetical protein ACR2QF_14200 [Geminicoccaceae bacterium]
MRKATRLSLILGSLAGLCLSTPTVSLAEGDFDGTKPLLCAVAGVNECDVVAGCQKVSAESVGVPRLLKVDLGAGTIATSGADGRTSAIENQQHVDGKLIIQGIEDGVEGERDGIGWSIAITKDAGYMVASASGDDVGFVIFGACSTP